MVDRQRSFLIWYNWPIRSSFSAISWLRFGITGPTEQLFGERQSFDHRCKNGYAGYYPFGTALPDMKSGQASGFECHSESFREFPCLYYTRRTLLINLPSVLFSGLLSEEPVRGPFQLSIRVPQQLCNFVPQTTSDAKSHTNRNVIVPV